MTLKNIVQMSTEDRKLAAELRLNAGIKQLKNKMQVFVHDLPDRYRKTFVTAFLGRSPTSGIKAKCLDCSNFQREEIKACELETCPLHKYRPYK